MPVLPVGARIPTHATVGYGVSGGTLLYFRQYIRLYRWKGPGNSPGAPALGRKRSRQEAGRSSGRSCRFRDRMHRQTGSVSGLRQVICSEFVVAQRGGDRASVPTVAEVAHIIGSDQGLQGALQAVKDTLKQVSTEQQTRPSSPVPLFAVLGPADELSAARATNNTVTALIGTDITTATSRVATALAAARAAMTLHRRGALVARYRCSCRNKPAAGTARQEGQGAPVMERSATWNMHRVRVRFSSRLFVQESSHTLFFTSKLLLIRHASAATRSHRIHGCFPPSSPTLLLARGQPHRVRSTSPELRTNPFAH